MEIKHVTVKYCVLLILAGLIAETIESAIESKRSKRSKEEDGGGIIIDVNNDYPSDNYYYDNYEASDDLNLNNTFKVESIDNEDNEKFKPNNYPTEFQPNESDFGGKIESSEDEYGVQNGIQIDTVPASPPQFKPAQQQQSGSGSQANKTILNSNNVNHGSSKNQHKSENNLTTKANHKFQGDYKLVLLSLMSALIALTILCGVAILACYRCQTRDHGVMNSRKPIIKTSLSKQYVAVEQT